MSAATVATEEYELVEVVSDAEQGGSLRRARRTRDGRRVLLAIPRTSSVGDVHRLRRELDVARPLDPELVVRPTAMSFFGGKPVLVLEDFGAKSLAELMAVSEPLAVGTVLEIAAGIARCLDYVHRQGIVHRDVKPDNVLVDPRSGVVKLTGFRIASTVRGEHWASGAVEGTPSYMSPEQTGRMNRPIDARSDLYSLGITLYEMFAGAHPFLASDLLGWVHAHLVRVPIPLLALSPRVPRPVSDLVMKLVAKLPEDRYQTAGGLFVDLERCLREWNRDGAVSPFRLGVSDVSAELRISKKTYGRKHEIDMLSQSFALVAKRGSPGLVLVSGRAGVGKTTLARTLEEPVARSHGIFVTGRFEMHEQRAPYSALARACQAAVPWILAEGPEKLDAWRTQFCDSLGGMGRLLVDLVPSLAPIVGPQPDVPQLPLDEAKNRYFLAVRKFVAALTGSDRVLVMLVDQLQWADAASLELLAHLVTHPDTGKLLLIGAYRDDELCTDHPLRSFLEHVRSQDTPITDIALGPLAASEVAELCADALSSSVERVTPLADLVHERTGGNALAVTQLLLELHRDRLLTFEAIERCWRWDPARIAAMSIRDDVVDATLSRLSTLGRSRQVLELGACLGTRFDVGTLALVTDATPVELHEALREGVEAGLLSVACDDYHFLHERIREAIYSSIPEVDRAARHGRIGRVLLERLSAEELLRRVFEVATQLNLGPLPEDAGERNRIAVVHLLAGRVAAATSAYDAAVRYLSTGIRLVEPDGWSERFKLTHSLHLECARCELARGNLDEAQRLVDLLREHKPDSRASVRDLTRLEMDVRLRRNEPLAAARIAVESLRTFGIETPLPPTDEELEAADRALSAELGGRSIDDLVTLPVSRDRGVEDVLDTLVALLPAAYLTEPKLHRLLAFRIAALALRHGVTGAGTVGFAVLAMELVATPGRFDDGARFGSLALRLIEKHGFERHAPMTRFAIGAFVAPYRWTLPEAIAILRSAHESAQKVGDLSFARYSAVQIVTTKIARGDPLGDIGCDARSFQELAGKERDRTVTAVLRVQRRLTIRLAEPAEAKGEDVFDERSPDMTLPIVAVSFHVYELVACCVQRDYEAALRHAEQAKPLLWAVGGQVVVGLYHLFAGLTRAALAQKEDLSRHADVLHFWSERSPQSYFHMHALLAAEHARLTGDTTAAIHLYEDAIRSAHDNGFVYVEALAYERAASFYGDLGLRAFSDMYAAEARSHYAAWGAVRKVRALDEARAPVPPAALLPNATLSAPAAALERDSLSEVSQTISSELVRPKLIEKVTQILLERAGARRAVFLSVRDDSWAIDSAAGDEGGGVPEAIVNHVLRARTRIHLHDATLPGPYSADSYVVRRRPRSVLCLPILRHGELLGIVYLENDLVPGAFTSETVDAIDVVAAQVGISLENARLYSDRIREVAEREQAEAMLRSVLDNMVAAVVGCDRAARVTFCNEAAAAMIATVDEPHPLVEDVTMKLGATHPDGTPFRRDEIPILRALAGEVVSSVAMTVRDPETSRATHLRVSAAPIQDQKGAIAGAVAVGINVTGATELDQLKEQFIRVVAHELKTPVTIVRGYAELLRGRGGVGPNTRPLMDALVRGADRIDRLVTELLLLWQVQTGQLALALERDVDLAEITAGVVRRIPSPDAERIVVDAERSTMVEADRELVAKALSSLVDNALRYSPDGGRVHVAVGARSPNVVVTVTDEGIGIPKEKISSLFEPFFRAHTDTPHDRGGIGLGLYLSKAIVSRHGGTIDVTSHERQGSTFEISLPQRQAALDVNARDAPAA